MRGVLLMLLATTATATPPAAIERVQAEYPAWARGSGLATEVSLRVRVAADGRAVRIEVVPYSMRRDILTRSLRASFDSAAVRAVRRWRFRPAMSAGHPVAAWLAVEVPIDEDWTQSGDPHPVMPDSIRSPALWNAVMGEWWRVPIRRTPGGRPSALRFDRGGRYLELDAAGHEQPGGFQIASDGSPDDSAARLVRMPELGGHRVDRMRFAGRDTLILCPWPTAGVCDTFVATARGARP